MAEPQRHCVHVWSRQVTKARPEELALLSADERLRARSFRVAAAAEAFISARVLLRQSLGSLSGLPPASLRLRIDAAGRPWLDEPAVQPPLYFSLSHAAGLAVCAVAGLPHVGVDVEALSRPLTLAAVRRVLAPDEIARVEAAPEADRSDLLLRLWTLKEAYGKAIGLGLGGELRRVCFEFGPGHPVLRHVETGADAAPLPVWSLRQLQLRGSHLFALALAAPSVETVVCS